MKKIVRLTESDLTRLVKRVIKESEESEEKIDFDNLKARERWKILKMQLDDTAIFEENKEILINNILRDKTFKEEDRKKMYNLAIKYLEKKKEEYEKLKNYIDSQHVKEDESFFKTDNNISLKNDVLTIGHAGSISFDDKETANLYFELAKNFKKQRSKGDEDVYDIVSRIVSNQR